MLLHDVSRLCSENTFGGGGGGRQLLALSVLYSFLSCVKCMQLNFHFDNRYFAFTIVVPASMKVALVQFLAFLGELFCAATASLTSTAWCRRVSLVTGDVWAQNFPCT